MQIHLAVENDIQAHKLCAINICQKMGHDLTITFSSFYIQWTHA
jgi:hypothetical protein